MRSVSVASAAPATVAASAAALSNRTVDELIARNMGSSPLVLTPWSEAFGFRVRRTRERQTSTRMIGRPSGFMLQCDARKRFNRPDQNIQTNLRAAAAIPCEIAPEPS
jgi:hypothetical protein